MSIIQAIILGAIQGLTEFIPVSSSGHLLVASGLFNIPSSFEAETLLNVGTLLAAIIYFRKDLMSALRPSPETGHSSLIKMLIIGSLPLLAGGVLFDLFLKDMLRNKFITVAMLGVIGLLMLAVKSGDRLFKSLTNKDALIIGLSQIVALIPGTSRSGITMLAGMKQGLNAETAARFSFLLSVPAVAAAIAYTLLDSVILGDGVKASLSTLVIGNVAAFITSLLAIHGMISFLKRRGLKLFGWYRLALGVILFTVLIL